MHLMSERASRAAVRERGRAEGRAHRQLPLFLDQPSQEGCADTRDMPKQTKTEGELFCCSPRVGDRCWRSRRTTEYRLNQTISMMKGSVENICAYLRRAKALLSIKNTWGRCGEVSNVTALLFS